MVVAITTEQNSVILRSEKHEFQEGKWVVDHDVARTSLLQKYKTWVIYSAGIPYGVKF